MFFFLEIIVNEVGKTFSQKVIKSNKITIFENY
jgi:hypothetical protein